LAIDAVDKSFGDRVVYRGLSARLQRGQRVAVAGLNGAGKSTLLRLIAGDLEPDLGSVALGHNVVMGYYAQHHTDRLNAELSVLEEIRALAPDKPESHLRGVLGAFLFSGDDVEKPVGVLSGGERARVALAKLLLKPSNLLLLDEPTNHLDLDSSEMLIEALERFEGTLLFVSHNRGFLNRLATHVWEVSSQTVNVFPGNLDDYLEKMRRDVVSGMETAGSGRDAERNSNRSRKRVEAEERQRRNATLGPIKKEVERLEKEIAEIEMDQSARTAALATPELYDDFAKAKPMMDAHRSAEAELAELYAAWEAAQSKLEALKP